MHEPARSSGSILAPGGTLGRIRYNVARALTDWLAPDVPRGLDRQAGTRFVLLLLPPPIRPLTPRTNTSTAAAPRPADYVPGRNRGLGQWRAGIRLQPQGLPARVPWPMHESALITHSQA